MNTILMNSENSKMSEPHSLLLNVADKILNNFDHFQMKSLKLRWMISASFKKQ